MVSYLLEGGREMVAGWRTLHHSRLVGRELDGVVANLHVDLIGEGDALEELLDGSRGAGDSAENGPSRGGLGGRHDQERRCSVGSETGRPSYTSSREWVLEEGLGLCVDVCVAIVQLPLMLFVPLPTTAWRLGIW